MSLAYKIEGNGSAFEQKDVSQTKYRKTAYSVKPVEVVPPQPQVAVDNRSYRDNNRYALSRHQNERNERPALAIAPPPAPMPEPAQAQPPAQPEQPAQSPAPEPPAPETAMPAPAAGQDVVSVALSLQGKPYRYGSEGPSAFDCSGFTKYCYGQVGVALPHSSRAQSGVGSPVAVADLKPGDLVFFGRSGVNHAGMYVGNGNFIHSPSPGETVRVQSLSSHSGYVGARRVQ